MKITGTLINYYFHCKRQCFLFGNRLNLEDNSENVKIGKAIHENKLGDNHGEEVSIENIKIDKITKDYLTEVKKSDADPDAAKWQLIFYLRVLKEKGIARKGKLEFVEKNRKEKKIEMIQLTSDLENELDYHITDIEMLLSQDKVPDVINEPSCKKCAYYEYCYI